MVAILLDIILGSKLQRWRRQSPHPKSTQCKDGQHIQNKNTNAMHYDMCSNINNIYIAMKVQRRYWPTIPGLSKASQSGYYFKQAWKGWW